MFLLIGPLGFARDWEHSEPSSCLEHSFDSKFMKVVLTGVDELLNDLAVALGSLRDMSVPFGVGVSMFEGRHVIVELQISLVCE